MRIKDKLGMKDNIRARMRSARTYDGLMSFNIMCIIYNSHAACYGSY